MNDQLVDSAVFRALLRREKIAARLALSPADHADASERVRRQLVGLLAAYPPGVLGFCLAVRGEVDCLPLVTELGVAGWSFVMPVVEVKNAPMRFRCWHPGAPMGTDPHGIPVPMTEESPPPKILLLPLVAWDADGYRLGYGGGYFDRTLAALETQGRRPLTIGVGFDLARVDTIRPAPHDAPLDFIVTESGARIQNLRQ